MGGGGGIKLYNTYAGSSKANGREPKTCLGWVFNYKFECDNNVHVLIYLEARPRL
jgi:hypothetical protein